MKFDADDRYSGSLSSDYCSAEGAEELARRIAFYWTDRGFPSIRTGTERIKGRFGVRVSPTETAQLPVYRVTSNIQPNGFPPRPT